MSAAVVTLETVEPHVTAVIAQTTTWSEFQKLWGPLLDEVYTFVRGRPELATGTSGELWQNVMLYENQQPEVEIGVLVSESFEPQGRVTASELPGGEVATAVHSGDYATLGATHDAVRGYAAAQGRELAGPCWEIYGHAPPDPSAARTEIFWLLR
jgi:effector-binding domain-containing protein